MSNSFVKMACYYRLRKIADLANYVQTGIFMEKQAVPWGMLARGGYNLLRRYLVGTARGIGVGLGNGAGIAAGAGIAGGAYLRNKRRKNNGSWLETARPLAPGINQLQPGNHGYRNTDVNHVKNMLDHGRVQYGNPSYLN